MTRVGECSNSLINDLNAYRKNRAQIARELCYPKSVVEAILLAKSMSEVNHILMNARKGDR